MDDPDPQGAPAPQTFWAAILSRRRRRILMAFESVSHEEQRAVVTHLRRMSVEAGWLPQQKDSAEAALAVIEGRGISEYQES
jgi:hypothetical protein